MHCNNKFLYISIYIVYICHPWTNIKTQTLNPKFSLTVHVINLKLFLAKKDTLESDVNYNFSQNNKIYHHKLTVCALRAATVKMFRLSKQVSICYLYTKKDNLALRETYFEVYLRNITDRNCLLFDSFIGAWYLKAGH